MCKKIHRGGNAEQYNADKKYKEAVAVAVEKCAADTMKHFPVRASDHGLSKSDAMLEMIEAAEMLEELARRARRVLGASHPFATEVQSALEYVRSLGVLERAPR